MAIKSNFAEPSIEFLRDLAAEQDVYPEDVDLEAVLGFLSAILPALAEIERRLPPEMPPALLP
jgi:hypothetical protein